MDKLTVEKRDGNATPPRMMSPRQVARTGVLPEHAIRAGIKAGWIPHIQCGTKALVNYDKLLQVLEDL